ncbi:MAG: MogA/MoaB family molybdenum cofactor biosynthesis protein, partial [Halanaerobiales bacterium]|nr:MogA/MoaB family molybdenum cofactor biosynthesis protein [Halanaerobiales bacterium]
VFMSEKNNNYKIRTAVLTISDKGSRGARKDLSGPVLKEMMENIGAEIAYEEIIADEKEEIKEALIKIADQKMADLILTTGGTGFAERDITPEATLEILEKEVPGIPEKIRADTISITPQAALSRARAGIRGKTLIINFPGSPKAVRECLQAVIDIIPHGVKILKGEITEHQNKN